MSTKETIISPFTQRSSWAIMIGGGLYTLTMAILHPVSEPLFTGTSLAITLPLGHAVHHAPELPAYALLAIGLVGLLRYQARQLGWLGKIGLFLSFIGFALMSLGTLGIIFFEGFLRTSVDALETVHPLLLLPLVGALLYGPALLRTRSLAPEGAWLIISAALMFLGLIFSGIIDTAWGYWVGKGVLTLFSAGWTWLGYAFWLEVHEPVRPAGLVNQTAN